MRTKIFEALILVHGIHDHYPVRVHANTTAEVEPTLRKLVPNLRRVWEFQELPAVLATGNGGTIASASDSGTLTWTGTADTDAGPGHFGLSAKVLVDQDGDIRVELYTPSIDAPFAPIDWKEEALALRATVRAMARELARRAEDASVRVDEGLLS